MTDSASNATEPRPMDPRELTELRELLEEQTAWEFFGQIPASDVVQYLEKLLADRDYQAQRAGRAEGESADLGLEFENATAHRDLLAAEIASLRAELDRKSLALLSAEQQLRWARDDGAKVREARDGARVETEDIRSALNTQRKLTDVAQAEVARLKAEVEQWRADALMYAELRDQVIEQRNALLRIVAANDADSLPVAGAILGLCRAAYGRHVFTEHHGDGLWRVHQAHREYVLGVGRTEHEALVHALECAPC